MFFPSLTRQHDRKVLFPWQADRKQATPAPAAAGPNLLEPTGARSAGTFTAALLLLGQQHRHQGHPCNKSIPEFTCWALVTLSRPSHAPQRHAQGDLPPAPRRLSTSKPQERGRAPRDQRLELQPPAGCEHAAAEGERCSSGSREQREGPAAEPRTHVLRRAETGPNPTSSTLRWSPKGLAGWQDSQVKGLGLCSERRQTGKAASRPPTPAACFSLIAFYFALPTKPEGSIRRLPLATRQ